jgi:hypothetical protein
MSEKDESAADCPTQRFIFRSIPFAESVRQSAQRDKWITSPHPARSDEMKL